MPNELKNGCVQLFSFLCSRVGLSIIVILYICFGGLIFQALEGDIEKTELEIFHDVVVSTDRIRSIRHRKTCLFKSENVTQDCHTFTSHQAVKQHRSSLTINI